MFFYNLEIYDWMQGEERFTDQYGYQTEQAQSVLQQSNSWFYFTFTAIFIAISELYYLSFFLNAVYKFWNPIAMFIGLSCSLYVASVLIWPERISKPNDIAESCQPETENQEAEELKRAG